MTSSMSSICVVGRCHVVPSSTALVVGVCTYLAGERLTALILSVSSVVVLMTLSVLFIMMSESEVDVLEDDMSYF